MCRRLGVSEVEIRNDIPDVLGTMKPHVVRDEAHAQGITILSINALYPFNVWSGDLPDRAQRMADYAAECGAHALVMCPLNDGRHVAHSAVVAALDAMKPVLRDRGLIGLVEPLGFPVSSLRTKAEAIAAFTETGDDGTYRLLHDTFHHHLAGETQVLSTPHRAGAYLGRERSGGGGGRHAGRASRAGRRLGPAGKPCPDQGAAGGGL